jgi:hypothetical protein
MCKEFTIYEYKKKIIEQNNMILLLGVSLYVQLMMSHEILNLYKVEIVMRDCESESCVSGDFIACFNIFRTVFLTPKYVMAPIPPCSPSYVASHYQPPTWLSDIFPSECKHSSASFREYRSSDEDLSTKTRSGYLAAANRTRISIAGTPPPPLTRAGAFPADLPDTSVRRVDTCVVSSYWIAESSVPSCRIKRFSW